MFGPHVDRRGQNLPDDRTTQAKQNRGGRRREAASMIAVPYRAYAVGVDRATHVGTWFYVPRFVTVCVLEGGSCPPVGSDSDLAQHSP